MWVFTQARKSDGQMFIVDLSHLGMISLAGPSTVEGESIWSIEASDGAKAIVLAYTTSHTDALAIQRRIFNALATGEKALNMNAGRKTFGE